jgi:hypothetical protein
MRSWPFALVVRSRPSYIFIALALGALHLGMWALAMEYLPTDARGTTADGDTWVYSINPSWNISLLFSVEVAYLLLTAHFVLRGARNDFRALQEVVESKAASEAQAELVRIPPLAWWLLPLIGILFWASHMAAMGELMNLMEWYSRMPGFMLWLYIVVCLFEIGVTFLVFCFVRTAWLLYRLSHHILEVNPLDVRPLQTFSRSGPRMALCLTGSLVITLPFAGLDAEFLSVPLVIVLVASLALFLLPLVRVRQRTIRARDEALELLGQALAGDCKALEGTRYAGVSNLADLVVIRGAVERTPTWPVSESGWWRFFTVTLLPLLSWAASRAIDHLLS